MTEHNEQMALFQLLQNNEETKWLFAIPNGGQRDIRVAMNLKREGVKAGVWDLFLPLPRGRYHGLFIEMKFGNNKLSASQLAFGQYVVEQGYKAKVAYSCEEAYNIIQEYLK